MKPTSRLRVWIGTLFIWVGTILATAGFSAAFSSLAVILYYRGWPLGSLVRGDGGLVVFFCIPAVGAYFLSRREHVLIGKCFIAILAYIMILPVQAVFEVVALCMLGECI
ncbi:MAG: hypothetical protein LBB55_04900 [Zoogloeaceae bacterium]|jgi:hypothetical protein|nr:hypothetical protein [Zoogloeaceae bacterium]